MQHRKKLTASFRSILKKGSDNQERQSYARWFSQLDLVGGKIFKDQDEAQALENKLAQRINDHFAKRLKNTRSFHFPLWASAAAAILLVVTVALLFVPLSENETTPLVFKAVHTEMGERKTVVLADGTRLMLNNLSTVKFPRHFSGSLREVFLEGEAFFEVAHDENKPFIVHTDKLAIQVLGTSFDVNSYAGNRKTYVTVSTGKVGVQAMHKKTSWMLKPGQQLAYHNKTGEVQRAAVDANDYSAWQKGQLIFKNETLANICKRLERWYAVKITIKTTTLNHKRISLKQDNESLQSVLKMLGMVAGFDYKIEEKQVQIW